MFYKINKYLISFIQISLQMKSIQIYVKWNQTSKIYEPKIKIFSPKNEPNWNFREKSIFLKQTKKTETYFFQPIYVTIIFQVQPNYCQLIKWTWKKKVNE